MGTLPKGNEGYQGSILSSATANHNISKKHPGWISQFFLFALNFVKHPNMVGWMLPSSPFVVDDVLKQVDWDNARVIVEFGPGVGTFTTKVLERMRRDATLVALEINPDFIKYLKQSVHDPRLHLVSESAAEVDKVLARLGFGHADYVISGIPFKTLPPLLRDTIVQKTHSVLRPDGQFLVYQLSSAALPHLQQVFGKVSRDFQWLSLIPAQMFYCAR
jgi:phospholipid N-methyltransferase